jgi:hypothetical protein
MKVSNKPSNILLKLMLDKEVLNFCVNKETQFFLVLRTSKSAHAPPRVYQKYPSIVRYFVLQFLLRNLIVTCMHVGVSSVWILALVTNNQTLVHS